MIYYQLRLFIIFEQPFFMDRHFFNIAYNGTRFSGWQVQDNAPSVQAAIEEALTKLYSSKISIIGCGRTDTGVHASDYFFHVDLEDRYNVKDLMYKLNLMLGAEILIKSIIGVEDDHHARFDATSRSYTYHLSLQKDPFRQDQTYLFDQGGNIDFELLNKAASLLLEFDEFFTFCKTHSDVTNYRCQLFESYWERVSEYDFEYHISANRFLRGMVRLIVGMCINVAIGKLDLEEVKSALSTQSRLDRAWSVPAKGLFLTKVEYPYIE